MALSKKPDQPDQLFNEDFDYFNRKRRNSFWEIPEILRKREAIPIQYMKAESKSRTARALWGIGVRKAKIMADIMRAFNLIEREIYIRGAEAKIDFAMYEKTEETTKVLEMK
jgi:hypothetical protein